MLLTRTLVSNYMVKMCTLTKSYTYIFLGWTPLFCLCSVLSDIAQSVTLETIETLAFNNLLNLSEM